MVDAEMGFSVLNGSHQQRQHPRSWHSQAKRSCSNHDGMFAHIVQAAVAHP
jgi:hypothetical protein